MAKHEIKSPVTGTIWMHSAGVGQFVYAGNPLLILEVMKMEIPVETPVDGTVTMLLEPGQVIEEGTVVAIVED